MNDRRKQPPHYGGDWNESDTISTWIDAREALRTAQQTIPAITDLRRRVRALEDYKTLIETWGRRLLLLVLLAAQLGPDVVAQVAGPIIKRLLGL